jgi:CDP-glucose 4,6-dehydratase
MEDVVMNTAFWKDKKALITGHTGFKGSWLALWLQNMGAITTGYSLEPPTKPSLFEICKVADKMTSLNGDVRDSKTLKEIFKEYKPEIVFHLAAQSLVRRSYREPLETYETNVMGTVNLFEVCRSAPSVRVIINVTSDKCYENRESIQGYKENDAMGGYDPYSSSKGCAELVTNAYIKSYFNPDKYKEHGRALASVRAGNVIGGGDWAEDRLIPDCIRAFMSKSPVIIRYPDAVRPWQHVLEPLHGYLLLAQRLYENGPKFTGAWNFGPDDSDAKSVRWIVEQIILMWGDNVSWRISDGDEQPHEAHHLKLDCSKAKTRLGWHPCWDLRAGLQKTIEWYKAYRNNEDMFNFSIDQIKSYEENLKNRARNEL